MPAEPTLARLEMTHVGFTEDSSEEAGLLVQLAREVDLSNNALGPVGGAAIGKALAGCAALESLQLDDCKIGDAGLQCMAENMSDCKRLKALKLANNGASAATAENLVKQALDNAVPMELLSLRGNEDVKDGGAAAIAGLLNACPTAPALASLELSACGITAAGLKSLLMIRTVQDLILFGNDIGPGLGELLNDDALFTHAAALVQLDLATNNIQDAEGFAIMQRLESQAELPALNIVCIGGIKPGDKEAWEDQCIKTEETRQGLRIVWDSK